MFVLFWMLLLCVAAAPLGTNDCIVVRVVVKERTDGAGDEKVLSLPRRESMFAVRVVPVTEEAP